MPLAVAASVLTTSAKGEIGGVFVRMSEADGTGDSSSTRALHPEAKATIANKNEAKGERIATFEYPHGCARASEKLIARPLRMHVR
jgi:hypothetical protein